ncbi:hypothetical protein AJ80_08496 [Polytolypa hystricis UAMH7299]|uniref:Uncharacterized protein n=1 Tax=Polytolypa hystricis (strain UAMH7299) TaxID=1447883 RepID=A0A2B7X747_POLH7|nr:hypothetical protein AJ80_08496 [Polytolypa hystricis UAMH7299]
MAGNASGARKWMYWLLYILGFAIGALRFMPPKPPSEDLGNRDIAICKPSDTIDLDAPSRKERFVLNSHPHVYGWPSTGGEISRSLSLAEVLYLGLDRFHEAYKAEDPAEEDEFCRKLRNLGAEWWESQTARSNAVFGEADEAAIEKAHTRIETGWPSSWKGVWVIKWHTERDYWALREKKLGRLELALNMDERCAIIESMGGQYFEDPKDCPDLW